MPYLGASPKLFVRIAATLLLTALSTAFADTKPPAEILIERSTTAMRTDPELSKRDAEAALEELKRQPNADLEIRARLLLCDYYSERDSAAATQQSNLAEARLPQAQRQTLRAGILNCRGAILETVGENSQAVDMYRQAVDVAAAGKDNELLADALFSRGYLLGLQGEYVAGLSDLQRSQTLYEELKKSQHALTVLNSIATLYNRMGDYAQAQHIYERALKAQHDAGMRREEAVTQHNLARAYENQQKWDAAREAFFDALNISRELNYPRGEAYALRGLAAVANGLRDPKTALEDLQRAAALQEATPDVRLNAQILLARGIALHQLQRLPESVAALEQALKIFMQAGSPNELGPTYAELSAAYAEMGNWHKAYEYRSESQQLSEKLLHNQLDQRFATLKVEFDTATKEKENASLIRENEANQKALAQQTKAAKLQTAVIVLTAILIVLLGILVLHQRRGTQRMQVLAMTDELTGVPNRRAALARLALLLKRNDAPACSLLIIDIDHFKSINDRYGHPVGDETLKCVSAKLSDTVYEPAFVGRLGGEEFVLVLPNTSLASAYRTAEALRESVKALDLSRWLGERSITVSIGLTVSAPGNDSPSAMLRRADTALYLAKNAGRNCVRSEPEFETEVSAEVQLSLLVANSSS